MIFGRILQPTGLAEVSLFGEKSSKLAQIHHLRPLAGETVLRISGAACLVETGGSDFVARCVQFWRAYWIDWRCFSLYGIILEPKWVPIFWKIWPMKWKVKPPKKVVSWVLGLYICTYHDAVYFGAIILYVQQRVRLPCYYPFWMPRVHKSEDQYLSCT